MRSSTLATVYKKSDTIKGMPITNKAIIIILPPYFLIALFHIHHKVCGWFGG
jgi:hypothetical protein